MQLIVRRRRHRMATERWRFREAESVEHGFFEFRHRERESIENLYYMYIYLFILFIEMFFF